MASRFASSPGGIPTTIPDVPISAVFLAIFIAFAVWNMSRFLINKKRLGYAFKPSALTFGFCMARNTTMIMRIVWSQRPNNQGVAIAASIFLQAGIIILYALQIVFSYRLFEQYHPKRATSPILRIVYRIYMLSILPLLVILVAPGVQSFLATDPVILKRDLHIRRFAILYMLVYVCVPVGLVAATWILGDKAEPSDQQVGPGHAPRLIDSETSTNDADEEKRIGAATDRRSKSDDHTATLVASAGSEKDHKPHKPRVSTESASGSTKGTSNVRGWSFFIPKREPTSNADVQRGSLALKSSIILLAWLLLVLNQSIKVSTSFLPHEKALGNPIFGKPALYCFNMLLEVGVLAIYALGEVPWRFGYLA